MKKGTVGKNTIASAGIGLSSRESIASQKFLEQPPSIQISHFWGSEDYVDATDWIELYDQIASDYNWTATNKSIRLGGYLKKHALQWYVQIIKMHPVDQTSWAQFKDMFSKRFSAPMMIPSPKSDRSSGTS